MKTYQVTVTPEDVTKTVNDGIAQGWTFINSELQSNGKMLLTFDTSQVSHAPTVNQPAAPKKKATTSPAQLLLLIVVLVCIVLYGLATSGEDRESNSEAQTTRSATSRPVGPVVSPTREVLTMANLPNHVSNLMENMDFDVTSIESSASTITAYAPSTSDDYDDIGDYRMAYIGGLSGALINFFNDARTDADPPQTIVVNFGNGRQVIVRITYQYADALAFYNGTITANQFFATWEVD